MQCQRDTPFLMFMELLLYTCVNMVAANAQLLEKRRIFLKKIDRALAHWRGSYTDTTLVQTVLL